MIGSPLYFLKRAVRNMWQSPVLSLAAVATVAVALGLLAFFAIAVQNVQQLTQAWSDELAVVVYLDKAPEAELLQSWRKEIAGYPGVSRVGYVSQEEAFERFRNRLANQADLLDGLEPSLLPASFEIQLKPERRNRTGVDTLVAKLKQNEAFRDLQYGQDWLEKFEAFVLMLRFGGAALGGFLVFAALVIVTNTIKLTLYARQDELEVMALVGGTSLFIKLPYLIEGAVQGVVGGLAALGASLLVFQVLLQQSLGNLLLITGIDTIHFLPPVWQVGLVVGGGLVGLLGSLFALRKFVKMGPV